MEHGSFGGSGALHTHVMRRVRKITALLGEAQASCACPIRRRMDGRLCPELYLCYQLECAWSNEPGNDEGRKSLKK